jgi:hypothetical protein
MLLRCVRVFGEGTGKTRRKEGGVSGRRRWISKHVSKVPTMKPVFLFLFFRVVNNWMASERNVWTFPEEGNSQGILFLTTKKGEKSDKYYLPILRSCIQALFQGFFVCASYHPANGFALGLAM